MIIFDKILLVDDENICNYITTKILNQANIARSTVSFLSAKAALDEIEHNSSGDDTDLVKLILLDINMPGMNGWDFLDVFERLPATITGQYIVMMLTSSIDNRDIEKSRNYPSVKKFISKPFSIDKIKNLE